MSLVLASADLSDDEFLAAFHSRRLATSQFRHADHLRLAWLHLHREPFDVALAQVALGHTAQQAAVTCDGEQAPEEGERGLGRSDVAPAHGRSDGREAWPQQAPRIEQRPGENAGGERRGHVCVTRLVEAMLRHSGDEAIESLSSTTNKPCKYVRASNVSARSIASPTASMSLTTAAVAASAENCRAAAPTSPDRPVLDAALQRWRAQ